MENSQEKQTPQKIDIGNTSFNPLYSKKTLPMDVIKLIEKHPEMSIYRIAKIMECNYKTILYIIRDLEFAGVLTSEIILEGSKAIRKIKLRERPVNESDD